jgi:hypothetical protein
MQTLSGLSTITHNPSKWALTNNAPPPSPARQPSLQTTFYPVQGISLKKPNEPNFAVNLSKTAISAKKYQKNIDL